MNSVQAKKNKNLFCDYSLILQSKKKTVVLALPLPSWVPPTVQTR